MTARVGNQADLILIDPEALRAYDSEANVLFAHREALGHEQMLNRSDGVVTDVWIAGQLAWRDNAATAALGTQRMGRALVVETTVAATAETPLSRAA